MHVRPLTSFIRPSCPHLGIQHQRTAPRLVSTSAIPWPGWFTIFSGSRDKHPQQQAQGKLGPGKMQVLRPRSYQQDLINIAKDANVLIALPTGSGKTLIAAEVIRHKLPSLKAAGKAVIFLAPTNPLVEQQCNEILIKKHGLQAIAVHGDATSQPINSWTAESWQHELSKVDVVVMTPGLLLLALCHASMQMQNIGLLIFDEAHHCSSDHPYAQIMEDFYECGSTSTEPRPQILALTASPRSVDQPGFECQGLQSKLHAKLVTVADNLRSELHSLVPVPANKLLTVDDLSWPTPDIDAASNTLEAASEIIKSAVECETLLSQLQKQSMLVQSGQMAVSADVQADLECFAEVNGLEGSVACLKKQVRAVHTCLLQLGPWAAAAAAYLDLLSGKDPTDDDSSSSSQQQQGFETDWAKLDIPQERGDDDGSEDRAAATAASSSCVLSDANLYKYMSPDDLGSQPHELIPKFRSNMESIITWLQEKSRNSKHITSPAELTRAVAAAAGSSMGPPGSYSTAALAAAAGGVLGLICKAGVMVVMSVLADLLFADGRAKTEFLNDPVLQRAAGDAAVRSDGGLRKFGEKLMKQVAFGTLQAQMFPHFAASQSAPAWAGPPLLSPKVVQMIQHLKRLEQGAATATNGDWWSAMVFLETKLATMVICKLVQSMPDVKQRLKAGYLIGDTDPGGGLSSISMNNKAQARVVQQFREYETNVLFATNIGSEGMDFKQCQAVVAFDPPSEVTQYIQARGRARKAGSHYYWLVSDSLKQAVTTTAEQLRLEAEAMEARSRELSNSNRADLQSLTPVLAPHDPSEHFCVASGGVATLRQAKVLLAAFCARLPGSEQSNLLQAYYVTHHIKTDKMFVTTVYLPSNSGILDPITAPAKCKKRSAKSAAALEAIKELYKIGRLDKYLQPSWIDPRHAAQLEAEAIPKFTYNFKVEEPLRPRTVNFTPAGTGNFTVPLHQNVTLHLHTFKFSSSSSSHGSKPQQQQQQVTVGSKRPLAAVNAVWQGALDSFLGTAAAAAAGQQLRSSSSSSGSFDPDLLLNLAVGAPDRCAAVPGSSSSSSSSKVLSYGVLLWEPLSVADDDEGDDDNDLLQWPAWTNKQQQQPHQVSLHYAGPVSLSPSELLRLMHYQQAADDHINWSSKRLLGVTQSDHQQQQQHSIAKPFQLDHFQRVTQSWSPPVTAAANRATTSSTAAAAAGPGDSAAAQLLEGAQICYLFVPLQQQQQQQQQHMIDWQGIDNMSAGIKSFAQVAADTYGLGSTSAAPYSAATAAAAAVPDQLSSGQIAALGAELQDRVVIAGHSSMLYRCKVVDLTMMPRTPAEFSWKCSNTTPAAVAAGSGTSDQTLDKGMCEIGTASNHAEYYNKRYSITGLNPDLPMISMAGGGRGWKKGLGLLANPLKPPALQARGSKAIQSDITDLTSPEAAAAAANLFGVAQQQQDIDPAAAVAEDPSDLQQQQQYLPLELCWFLPLTAGAWADLLLLPAFMYRLNFLLRVRKLQQRLQQLANSSSSSSSRSCPMFCVPRSDLLAAAVSGSSAGEVFDQEGLEYLGDVVLKFIATNYLLQSERPDSNEGDLSVKKARLVRNVQLYQAAQQTPLLLQQHLHLTPFLQNIRNSHRNNSFTPTGWYPRVQAAAAAAGAASSSSDLGPLGLYSQGMEPQHEERGKRLADGVEALIGAVYLTAAGAAAGGGNAAAAASSSGGVAPVSMSGIAAAAAFCEAVGVMPQGSAALACQPPVQDTFNIQQQQQGSALKPRQSQQQQQQQQQIEQILGYHFSSPSLVSQASTHVSVLGVVSYQRLEFLGDALLDLMVSGWLLDKLAAALRQQHTSSVHHGRSVYAPAVLTRARAALVNNTHLGRAAAAAGLQNCINLRSRFLSKEMRKFAAAAAAAGKGLQEEEQQSGSSVLFRGGPVVAAAQVQDAAAVESGWSNSDLDTWQQVWMSGSSLDEDDDDHRTDDVPVYTAAAAAAAVDEGVSGNGIGSSTKQKSHHPKPPKALADVVESLIGAVFVDSMAQQQQQQQQQQQRQQSAGAAVASWEATWIAVQQLLGLH